MKLQDLPDDFTPSQFMQLDREGLDQVPYEKKKWLCHVKGCCNGTRVRDYGISPFFFLERNSKYSLKNAHEYWRNLNVKVWLCGKHYRWVQRLEKSYSWDQIWNRVMDKHTLPVGKVIDLPGKKMDLVQKAEGDFYYESGVNR